MSNTEESILEEQISSKDVFSGKLLEVSLDKVSLPSGRTARREVVHHPGGVVIIPILEENEGNKILMVKQFRQPIAKAIWELPAGTLEPGESARECAHRELVEETGFAAEDLDKKVELYTSPGYSDEVLAIFQATSLVEADISAEETPEDETLVVRSFSVNDLLQRAIQGKIRDGKTLAGLFFVLWDRSTEKE